MDENMDHSLLELYRQYESPLAPFDDEINRLEATLRTQLSPDQRETLTLLLNRMDRVAEQQVADAFYHGYCIRQKQ